MLTRIFSRKWLLATFLVLAAGGVMVRLGIWQLDRLEKRRDSNARISAQLSQPVLELNGAALAADLAQMEYRSVIVKGEYDPAGEIALRNQYLNNEWGVHLLTPLKIAGSEQAVLVDRGWIPGAAYESGDWSQFGEPGEVTVHGVIRASRNKAELGSRSDPTPVPGAAPLKSWNFINIPEISQQFAAPLLPIYIQQAADPAWTGAPQRTQPELELTEGPHMGYALQWFTFAALLVFGYPFYIRWQEKRIAQTPSVLPGQPDIDTGSAQHR
jgi:surfeit locus 1 family protein